MNKILALLKEKKNRKWIIAVIAMVVVGLLAAPAFSPTRARDTTANNQEAKVVSLNVAQTIEASGSLEAQPAASLDWKTDGVVKAVNVEPGDFVKKDAILLTLEPSSTSASIVTAQADLVEMQEDLEDYNDLKELRKAKVDPKNQHGRPFDVVATELGLMKKKA